MTTLADMTPEKRAECVGMWHDTIFGLVILEKLQEDPEEGDPFGLFRHPRTGAWHTEDFTGVTPRFDLPRAWTPDGTPPSGHWDYGEQLGYTVAPAEGPECANLRCWVSDWEPVE